ncbi:hypothetical protein KI688_004252 [Linnemannia hyalina]|uniref:Uncharacterized protein n=1 Tax=Linnemannia hyalina TaxID=64524 RepID=A0A9P8BPH4_9FUNG|nr:hypothetical protein KI688_004252 [Linnemannia hyalina]
MATLIRLDASKDSARISTSSGMAKYFVDGISVILLTTGISVILVSAGISVELASACIYVLSILVHFPCCARFDVDVDVDVKVESIAVALRSSSRP